MYNSTYENIKFTKNITSAYISILLTSKKYYTPYTVRKMSKSVVE